MLNGELTVSRVNSRNSGWLSKGATLTDKGGKIANNDSLIKSGNFNQDAYVQIPNKSFGGEDNIEGWSELLKGNSSRKESNRIANIKGVSATQLLLHQPTEKLD